MDNIVYMYSAMPLKFLAGLFITISFATNETILGTPNGKRSCGVRFNKSMTTIIKSLVPLKLLPF